MSTPNTLNEHYYVIFKISFVNISTLTELIRISHHFPPFPNRTKIHPHTPSFLSRRL